MTGPGATRTPDFRTGEGTRQTTLAANSISCGQACHSTDHSTGLIERSGILKL